MEISQNCEQLYWERKQRKIEHFCHYLVDTHSTDTLFSHDKNVSKHCQTPFGKMKLPWLKIADVDQS